MSTKSTIAYGPNFHLYNEVLDENFVYLELEGVQFEAAYNRVMVPVPIHIWEFIRQHPGIDLEWADKTDAEIREYVENGVDDRLRRYEEAAETKHRGLIGLSGSLVYGAAGEPRQKQIGAGTEYFSKLREHHRQIKQAIGDLEQG